VGKILPTAQTAIGLVAAAFDELHLQAAWWPIGQSANRPVDQSANRPVGQSASRPIGKGK